MQLRISCFDSIEELDGLVSLGLLDDARDLARNLLGRGFESADHLFHVVVTTLSLVDSCNLRWKTFYRQAIENALAQLPPQEKRRGLRAALIFFSSLNMKGDALKVLGRIDSLPEDPLEAAMTLHLLKGKRHAARRKKVVAQTLDLLMFCEDPDTEAFLLEALEDDL